MRRIILLTAIAALALAGSAAAARHAHPRHVQTAHHTKGRTGTIYLQRGIGGATLGMSPYRVRTILGFPVKIRHSSNEFGWYTTYRYKGLIVIFQGGTKATAITTHNRKYQTVTGVGVGSTLSEVRAGVPGVHCRTQAGFRHCLLGAQLAGHRVTDFVFKKGVVGRVVVGFVID